MRKGSNMSSNLHFSGITLSNTSKQLNIEISAIRKDLEDAINNLKANQLLFNHIESIFNASKLEIEDTNPLQSDDYVDIKLNLSQLFTLMITYGCSIKLSHISKLKSLTQNDDAKSCTNCETKTCDHCDAKSCTDINIWKIFYNENKNNKYNICNEILNAINKINKQTCNNPILLFYGTIDDSINDTIYAITYKNIAMMNNIIWTDCKNKYTIKTSLDETNENKESIHIKRAKSTPIKSKQQPQKKVKRGRSMTIPKKIFPPYHNKNYHLFGRRHNLPEICMEEVEKHNTKESCWLVVDELVLDVTSFLPYHPASQEAITKNGGKISDRHFKFHSKTAQKLLFKFVIGRVQKENHCIIQ